MSIVKTRMSADLVTSLKAKDALAVSVLRHTLGTIQSQEKGGKTAVEFNDDQVLAVIAQLVKQRRETAALYVEKGITDQAEKETAEADFLQTYLPAPVSNERIAEAVAEVVDKFNANGPVTGRDFGAIMKDVMALIKNEGSVDGKAVSTAVKNAIN